MARLVVRIDLLRRLGRAVPQDLLYFRQTRSVIQQPRRERVAEVVWCEPDVAFLRVDLELFHRAGVGEPRALTTGARAVDDEQRGVAVGALCEVAANRGEGFPGEE